MAHLKIEVSNGYNMELALYLMEFLRRRGECQFMTLYFSLLFSRLSVYNISQGVNNKIAKVRAVSKDIAEVITRIN